MITILNTSIITAEGDFSYKKIGKADAAKLVSNGFESAIRHESTAQIISKLLDIDCQVNRVNFSQKPGTSALVFKLNGRPAEGTILSTPEIEKIGYSWALLEMKQKPDWQAVYKSIPEQFKPAETCPGCGGNNWFAPVATKPCKGCGVILSESTYLCPVCQATHV